MVEAENLDRESVAQESMAQEAEALYVGRVELGEGVLNVRSEPGGSVIGQLQKGDLVNVLEDLGEWVKIAGAGTEGFAAKRYICFAQSVQRMRLVIEDEAGNAFVLEGGFVLRMTDGPID